MFAEPIPLADETHQQQISLVCDALRLAGRLRLRVQGASMLPALWPGDVLTVDSNSEPLVCGDIVMVERDGRLFVHRLVARDGSYWITCGDAVPQNDPPVESRNVLGKIVGIQRGKREWSPRANVSLFEQCVARLLAKSDCLKSLALRSRNAFGPGKNRGRRISLELS